MLKTKMLFFLIILFGIFCLAKTSQAATYYVKNGGNDSAAGTSPETAWANAPGMCLWTGGASPISPGDTVYFDHDGIWEGVGLDTNCNPATNTSALGILHIGHYSYYNHIASGTAGNPITIDGATWGTGSVKARATIKSTGNHGAIAYISSSYINFKGFELDGNSTGDGSGIVVGGVMTQYGDSNPTNINIDNCIIHDIGATNTYLYGIAIGPFGNYTISNVTVTNTIVYNTQHEGIAIYPSWTIAGSHPVNDTILIRNCTVYNTGLGNPITKGFGDGISVANDSRNVTLEFNTIYNTTPGVLITAGSHGQTWSPTNVTVRYNLIYNTGSMGIGTGIDTGPVTPMTASIYGNLLYNNGNPAVLIDGVNSYCIGINVDKGDFSTSVLNFYNNTVYASSDTCTFNYGVAVGLSDVITGTPTINFKNNIISVNNRYVIKELDGHFTTHLNNLYYRATGTDLVQTWYPSYRIYTTFDITDYDPNTKTTNLTFTGGTLPTGFSGNPGTVSLVGGQWVVTGSSLVPNTDYFAITSGGAIDNGATLGSPYNGCINGAGLATPILRPQGTAYDIGAYEYQGTITDTTPPNPPTGVSVN